MTTKSILIAAGIFPPDIGGPATYSWALANGLAGRGFKVKVITYGSTGGQKDFANDINVIRVSRAWPKGLRHMIYFLRLFYSAKKTDLIFAQNAVSAGSFAATVAKLRKKRFIVKVVSDYAWDYATNHHQTIASPLDFAKEKKTGKAAWLYKLQIRTCNKATLIIVPSDYVASLVRGWGIDEKKIKVVHNAVNLTKIEISEEEAKKKIGISGHIILSVGRLIPIRGFRMLIKIMPRLLEINQFFRLVIVGDGSEKKLLGQMIRNLGLENKVLLVGAKSHEEIPLYLAASTIYLSNTSTEGFPHHLLEAMSLGVPIITTAVGGNLEIIEQGVNGFMVRYNDEFNLVEAVRTLFGDKELQKEFVEEGHKTAAKFTVEKMLDKTIELL